MENKEIEATWIIWKIIATFYYKLNENYGAQRPLTDKSGSYFTIWLSNMTHFNISKY